MTDKSPAALLPNLLHFARILRAAGIEAGPGRLKTAAQALASIDLKRRDNVYFALRAALVSHRDDLALFDYAFGRFFFGAEPGAAAMPRRGPALAREPRNPAARQAGGAAQERRGSLDVLSDLTDNPSAPAQTQVVATYSALEVLRAKDFEKMSAQELEATKRLMRLLQLAVAPRRSRRLRPLSSGRTLDLRRLMRLNLRLGGEMLRLTWRGPKLKRRPLVLLCDISGSMERYSRLLLHFVHAVKTALEDVEAFVFATRLTRISRCLRTHDVDAAVSEVATAVQDWASGTRIGDALGEFNRRWGRRVLGQGAVVVIISDGWDRGQVDLLREEMARLQRACHRLIWMNPLLGQTDYQPLTVGMAAALPYADDFLAAHNLASLESLAALLAEERQRRPVRRQHRARAA